MSWSIFAHRIIPQMCGLRSWRNSLFLVVTKGEQDAKRNWYESTSAQLSFRRICADFYGPWRVSGVCCVPFTPYDRVFGLCSKVSSQCLMISCLMKLQSMVWVFPWSVDNCKPGTALFYSSTFTVGFLRSQVACARGNRYRRTNGVSPNLSVSSYTFNFHPLELPVCNTGQKNTPVLSRTSVHYRFRYW